MAGTATMQKGRGQNEAPADAKRLIPFVRASREHTEPAFDHTVSAASFAAGPTEIGPFDLPAFGYARHLVLLVEASGGAGTPSAVSAADGPWNVIRELSLSDVNGAPIVGPMSGFDLMLANKWGGYAHDADPTRSPAWADISDTGFSFLLRVPLEITSRDAYGALSNKNASSTYKVRISVADDGDVYGTSPGTLPDVRIRGYLEAWAQPGESDPKGNPQLTKPPALGTTQFWSKATYNIANGSNTVKLARVGNYLRTLAVIFRDSGGDREGASVPDPVQLFLDGRSLENEAFLVRRSKMAERYGYELGPVTTADDDEGVWVYDFSHDFDGKPGGELRNLWLPTSQSSRLEIVGTFGEVGAIDVLTNDVSPVGDLI